MPEYTSELLTARNRAGAIAEDAGFREALATEHRKYPVSLEERQFVLPDIVEVGQVGDRGGAR
jgi:hypothetical protein